jgi:hypothetical protein
MNEWKTTGGRLTLLPAAPIPTGLPSALELFRRAWGTEPDVFQKPSNPLMPSVAQGNRANLTFACMSQPARIDFSISPYTPFQDPAQAHFPVIEDTSQFENELIQVIDVVGTDVAPNSIFRVGASIQFMNFQPTIANANKVLMAVIPANYGVKIGDEEDVVFQVNRPYKSHVEDIRMNQLIKWSVDRLNIVTMSFPTLGTPTLTAQPVVQEFVAASVTFDNNNAPSKKPLSAANQKLLLRAGLEAALQTQQDIGLRVEGFRYANVSH